MSTRVCREGAEKGVVVFSLVTKGACRDEPKTQGTPAFETDMKGTIYFPSASDYVYWFDAKFWGILCGTCSSYDNT